MSLNLLHFLNICPLDYDGIIEARSIQSIEHKNFVKICESDKFSHGHHFISSCRTEVFEARDVPRQQHSDSSQQPWSGNTGDQSGELNAWGKEHHVEAQDWLYTGGHIGKMLNDKTRFNMIFYETISNDIGRFCIN